jgi:hypothetical protein
MNITHAAGLVVGQQSLIWILIAVVALQMFLLVFVWLRLSKLNNSYNAFMAGRSGASLEDMLADLLTSSEEQNENMKDLYFALRQLEQKYNNTTQHVGVVRFNAFPDAGSDLSFAVAVLDGNRNGFVLSSIYGRDESRVYAKPVKQGESDYFLSQEEEQAIGRALKIKER